MGGASSEQLLVLLHLLLLPSGKSCELGVVHTEHSLEVFVGQVLLHSPKQTQNKININKTNSLGPILRHVEGVAHLFVLHINSFWNVLAVDEFFVGELCDVTECLLTRARFLQAKHIRTLDNTPHNSCLFS